MSLKFVQADKIVVNVSYSVLLSNLGYSWFQGRLRADERNWFPEE